MTAEEREYRRWRWLVVVAAAGGAAILVWLSFVLFPRLGFPSGSAAVACGCENIRWSISGGASLVAMAVIGLTASMVSYGTWRFIRRLRIDVQLGRLVRRTGRRVVHQSTGMTYWLFEDQSAQAMTVGWYRPSVGVTTGMVRRLTGSELTAVLRHERAHQRAADPLWSAVLEALAAAWWWLPMIQTWAQAAYRLRELAADQAAIRTEAERTHLGGAVLKLAVHAAGPRVAFSPNRDRVEKLLNPHWRPQLGRWRWAGVGIFACLMIGLGWATHRVDAAVNELPPMVKQMCQEVRVACQSTTSEPSTSVMLCIDQGGWRCAWIATPRMSQDVIFSPN